MRCGLWSSWLRFPAALVAVGLATFLQFKFTPQTNLGGNSFFFYIVAVLLSGWFGGRGPGLLATAASILILDLLFLTPHTLFLNPIQENLWVVVMTLGGSTFSILCGYRDRSQKRLRTWSHQQEAVVAFGRAALQRDEPAFLMEHAVRDIARILQVGHVAILETGDNESAMNMAAAVGWDLPSGPVSPQSNTRVEPCTFAFARDILQSPGPVIVGDLFLEPRFDSCPQIRTLGLHSGLGITIRAQDRTWGVIEVFSAQKRRFAASDVHFLQAMASILALAMDRHATHQERIQLHRSIDTQRQLFLTVADYAPVGIAILDSHEFGVKWYNPALRNILDAPWSGMPHESRPGKDLFSTFRESGLLDHCRAAVTNGQPYVNPEFEFHGFQRGVTYWHSTMTPLPATDGAPPDLMLLLLETTAQVRARKKVEQLAAQAQASIDRLQAILSHMNEGVTLADIDGKVLLMNPAALRLHGCPNLEQCPRTLEALCTRFELRTLEGQCLRPDQWPLARALRGECFTDMEVQVRRQDTADYWIASFSGNPVLDAEGRQVMAVQTVRDVTLQKESEAERKRLLEQVKSEQRMMGAIFENAPEGIVVADPDGRIIMANPVAVNLFGRPIPFGEDFESHAVLQIRQPDGAPVAPGDLPLTRSALQGVILNNVELMIALPDDTSRMILMNAAPILNGQGRLDGAIAVFQDITAAKEIERERWQLQGELHRRAEELARLNRAKDEFLAMLAHELRNPLAPIISALHIMLAHGAGVEPAVKRSIDMVERQIHHMARLLDDLLDVSRITRGKIILKKELLNLADIVQGAIESCRTLIENNQHQLTLQLAPGSLWVEADPARLEQVIANLINNAAKYTKPGGRIAVELSAHPGQAELRVRDNGIGIAPEMLPRIFDLFSQVENSLDRAQGGLGIGLTLVKRLLELHGGEIEARSLGLGQGSEFIFHLPLLNHAASPAEFPEAGDPADTTVRELRVLVVEDNTDTALAMSEVLELWGHEVRLAYDGPGALEIALIYRPEVILLDIGLPGMDGYQVAQALRQDARFKSTVLIAITGYGQADDVRHAHEVGIDHHFTKPVDLVTLRQLLSGPLQRSD